MSASSAKRRVFALGCKAIGYCVLQLLTLPLDTLDCADIQAGLTEIGRG